MAWSARGQPENCRLPDVSQRLPFKGDKPVNLLTETASLDVELLWHSSCQGSCGLPTCYSTHRVLGLQGYLGQRYGIVAMSWQIQLPREGYTRWSVGLPEFFLDQFPVTSGEETGLHNRSSLFLFMREGCNKGIRKLVLAVSDPLRGSLAVRILKSCWESFGTGVRWWVNCKAYTKCEKKTF